MHIIIMSITMINQNESLSIAINMLSNMPSPSSITRNTGDWILFVSTVLSISIENIKKKLRISRRLKQINKWLTMNYGHNYDKNCATMNVWLRTNWILKRMRNSSFDIYLLTDLDIISISAFKWNVSRIWFKKMNVWLFNSRKLCCDSFFSQEGNIFVPRKRKIWALLLSSF